MKVHELIGHLLRQNQEDVVFFGFTNVQGLPFPLNESDVTVDEIYVDPETQSIVLLTNEDEMDGITPLEPRVLL